MSPTLPKRRLNLVRGETLGRIVQEAVQQAIDRSSQTDLADNLVAELTRGIREGGRSIKGMSRRAFLIDLHRKNSDLLHQRDAIRQELDSLQHDIEAQAVGGLKEAPADAGEHADTSGEEMKAQLARLFERAGSESVPLEVLQGEVEQLFGPPLDAGSEPEIVTLRRRVQKLKESLDQSEGTLSQLLAHMAQDPGMASIYREVQGLDPSSQNAERKRRLLDQIFRANLELKQLGAA